LRFLWCEAGAHAVRRDPELKRFYRRKLVQKGLGRARVAVARKLGKCSDLGRVVDSRDSLVSPSSSGRDDLPSRPTRLASLPPCVMRGLALRDTKFEHWYNSVFATVSAASTLLFILGSLWVVSFGSRTVRRAFAWIATSAFVVSAHWYIFFGPDRKDLRIGYFLWWLSFLLLALGLFDLSGSIKVDKGSQ
jgi:hypothetical protein